MVHFPLLLSYNGWFVGVYSQKRPWHAGNDTIYFQRCHKICSEHHKGILILKYHNCWCQAGICGEFRCFIKSDPLSLFQISKPLPSMGPVYLLLHENPLKINHLCKYTTVPSIRHGKIIIPTQLT